MLNIYPNISRRKSALKDLVFGKQLWLVRPGAPTRGCALVDWLIDVHWLYIGMVSWNSTSNSNKVGFESRSLLTGCTCRETLSDLLGAAPLITQEYPRAPVSTCLCKSVVRGQKRGGTGPFVLIIQKVIKILSGEDALFISFSIHLYFLLSIYFFHFLCSLLWGHLNDALSSHTPNFSNNWFAVGFASVVSREWPIKSWFRVDWGKSHREFSLSVSLSSRHFSWKRWSGDRKVIFHRTISA